MAESIRFGDSIRAADEVMDWGLAAPITLQIIPCA
jgi:hypothetical protein